MGLTLRQNAELFHQTHKENFSVDQEPVHWINLQCGTDGYVAAFICKKLHLDELNHLAIYEKIASEYGLLLKTDYAVDPVVDNPHKVTEDGERFKSDLALIAAAVEDQGIDKLFDCLG